jgi:diketogulonate reductase-like aldo/keto reductase
MTAPRFLYGTAWKEERTHQLTLLALRNGFRGIDTANQRKHYFEAAVGEAVVAAKVPREELFLQTKFTCAPSQDSRLPYEPSAPFAVQVRQSFESSLQHLQTSYLDSYLLHGPVRRDTLSAPDWEVWRAFESLHAEGRVRALGISNVALRQLQQLQQEAKVKPSFVQNRCFARTRWDGEIREHCRQNQIVYQGFSLLTANTRQLQSSQAVQEILRRRELPLAQLVFAFALQVGMLPLTGTSSAEHMQLDLAAQNLQLEAREIEAIENAVSH